MALWRGTIVAWLVVGAVIFAGANKPEVQARDYVAMARTAAEPTDPLYVSSQPDLRKVGLPEAWGLSIGSGVLVAVIDTGIAAGHEDLAGQWTYAAGHSPADHVFLTAPVSSGCSIPSAPSDDAGHGSHVAGTIAA